METINKATGIDTSNSESEDLIQYSVNDVMKDCELVIDQIIRMKDAN